jgi:hypothetical protein
VREAFEKWAKKEGFDTSLICIEDRLYASLETEKVWRAWCAGRIGKKVTDEQIVRIALANGFKLKPQPDGTMWLNPYVFQFARALLANATHEADDSAE